MRLFTSFQNLKLDYDPSEPRDADGKWGSGGSSASAKSKQKVASSVDHVETGSGKQEFHHGTIQGSPELHIGQTFADNKDTADNYAKDKTFSGEVDMSGLKIAHVKPFDRDDANFGALGDSKEDISALQDEGIDLIIYDDEDPEQRQHKAYRVVSDKALDRFKSAVNLTDNRPDMIAKEAVDWEGFPDSHEEIAKDLKGKSKEEIQKYLIDKVGDEDSAKEIIRNSKANLSSRRKNMKSFRYPAKFESGKTPSFGDKGIPNLLVAQVGFAKGHYCQEIDGSLVMADDQTPREKLIPIYIDQKTLLQFVESGNSRPEVKAKMKHGEVDDLIGGYKGFRMDGDAVRADFTFLSSLPESEKSFIIELATRFSSEVGNSVDFAPTYELGNMGGKKIALARCKKLDSVDIVDSPAATNSLFEENQNRSHMADTLSPEIIKAIGDAVGAAHTTAAEAMTARMGEMEKKLAKYESPEVDDSEEGKKKKKEDEDAAAEKMAALVAAKLKLSAEPDPVKVGRLVKEQLSVLTGGKPIKLSSGREVNMSDPHAAYEEAVALKLASKKDDAKFTRAHAIRAVAHDEPEIFNAYMKANGQRA